MATRDACAHAERECTVRVCLASLAGAQVGVGGGRQKVRALPAVDEGAEGMSAARLSERGDTQKGRWREKGLGSAMWFCVWSEVWVFLLLWYMVAGLLRGGWRGYKVSVGV